MKTYLSILIIFLLPFLSEGQSRKSDERKREEQFAFIDSKFDATYLKYIHTFQCNSKAGDDISSLLRAIRIQAVKMGANCFKLKSFTRNDTTSAMTLILETYYATERQIELTSEMHEKNVIYIISDDKFNDKIHTFQLNGEKIRLKSGNYFKYYLKVGEEVIINKGGFGGTTMRINWQTNKTPDFLTITGFAFADPSPFPSQGASVRFTTGKIHYLTTNLGLLLSNTLQLSR